MVKHHAAVASGGSTTKKTTMRHRASSRKYAAIMVGNSALKTHPHRSDVIGAPVPQNNMKAARAFCAALPALTPAPATSAGDEPAPSFGPLVAAAIARYARSDDR